MNAKPDECECPHCRALIEQDSGLYPSQEFLDQLEEIMKTGTYFDATGMSRDDLRKRYLKKENFHE
jgi:hypothetical protein